MKAAILASLILGSIFARAQGTEVLTCPFTEPFFTLEIDMVKKEVRRISYDWDDVDPKSDFITEVIEKNISVASDLSDPFLPKHQILKATGTVFAEIKMDMQGSDGMSDITFPYSIVYDEMHGGCDSNLINPVDPNQY